MEKRLKKNLEQLQVACLGESFYYDKNILGEPKNRLCDLKAANKELEDQVRESREEAWIIGMELAHANSGVWFA